MNFNPRAPYGARRGPDTQDAQIIYNFNPRAPYGARQFAYKETIPVDKISIHAPHTGRDGRRKAHKDAPD